MKAIGIFIGIAIAFCLGFLVARWPQVQPDAKPFGTELTTNDDIAIQEYESLVYHLQESNQTNALKELNDFLNDQRALQDDADLSKTVAILQGMRGGKTNIMLSYFENHLDMQIGLFASEYRGLPMALQKQINLNPLQRARDYRTKFPFKSSNQFFEEEVTNAFKVLNDK
jgi:hypothetical protein